MASIKNFKKELVYTYGALLDECYIVEMVYPKADREKLQALCQEIEQAYEWWTALPPLPLPTRRKIRG